MARRAPRRRLIALTLLIGACAPVVAQTPDAGYQAEFRKWQQEQIKDLKDNWLPLVGLFWLKEGDNTFGSDRDARISLQRDYLLGREGAFRLKQGTVWFEASPGSHVRLGNASFHEAMLMVAPPGPATELTAGGLRMFVIKRADRYWLRVKDLDSEAARKFQGLDFYPLSAAYIVKADFVPGNGRTMTVPDVIGDRQQEPVAGQVRFRLNGQELRLDAMEGEKGALFIVFSDLSKKRDTYPGGRFLDTDPPKDGKVVLDFNRAYSPPCAFTPYATCPLPPRENQLQVEIAAGEKYSRHH